MTAEDLARDDLANGARLERLAPQARLVQLIGGLIGTAFLGVLLLVGDLLWRSKPDGWPLPDGGAALILIVLLTGRALVYPFFWYRAWRYGVRTHDVLLRHGVLWRVERSVPRRRIQHVDIQSGPVDRLFGLCRLTLYTAGSGDEDGAVPGLRVADAERLRDRLLASDDGTEPAAAAEPGAG